MIIMGFIFGGCHNWGVPHDNGWGYPKIVGLPQNRRDKMIGGYPQNTYIMEHAIYKWMIWLYPHFWKPS